MSLKKITFALFVTGFILFAWLFAVWLFLPGFLETRLLPELALKNGIGWRQGRIHRIGLTGFDAGAVVIGRGDRVGLEVDAVHADYTPWGLVGKRVDAVHISGLRLNVSLDGHGASVKGLEGVGMAASPERKPVVSSAPSPGGGGVDLGTIRISQAVVNLEWQGRQWRIPFELTARLVPGGDVNAVLALYPCGDKVMLAVRWFPDHARGDVSLTAEHLFLEKIAAMVRGLPHPLVTALRARGEVAIRAGASIGLKPLAVENLVFSLVSNSLDLHYRGIDITALPGGGAVDKDLSLRVRQIGADRFKLEAGNLAMASPVPVILESLAGEVTLRPDFKGAALQAAARVPAVSREAGLKAFADKDLVLTAEIVAGQTPAGGWHLDITGLPAAGGHSATSLSVAGGEVSLVTGPPAYRARLTGRGSEMQTAFAMTVNQVAVTSGERTVRIARATLEGKAATGASGAKVPKAGSADLVLSGIEAVVQTAGEDPSLRAVVPEVRGRVELEPGQGSNRVMRGYVALAESNLAVPQAALTLSGITARVPWEWPVTPQAPKGLFSVGGIQWKHLDMGALGLTVAQSPNGLAFSGHHLNRQLTELSLDLSGDLQFAPGEGPRARFAASWSRPPAAGEIDLGRFVKGGAGIYVSGALNGELAADYGTQGMRASACVRLDSAAVRIPQSDLLMDELSVGVCLPHLPQLTTSPSQTLTFAQATMGKFKITDGRFHFQLEPHKTLFVEKGRVGWCDGQIRLQPLRITPGIDEYDLRLDCDRLNLAAILGQLSVADARGEGTVNGTIPVSFTQGRVHFNDGFLYSTPGDGGKISLRGADALMAGIPQGTRQFFQVDLAREALKDFDYTWVKLRMVSEGEELRMRLQFDGKPGRILPFEYDETIGGFVRVGAESRGSEFQGINLDVNFRVPLNDLMAYRDVLKMFDQ